MLELKKRVSGCKKNFIFDRRKKLNQSIKVHELQTVALYFVKKRLFLTPRFQIAISFHPVWLFVFVPRKKIFGV